MVLPEHTCPFGVEEHILSSRDADERFKAGHGVETTPQVFIEDERIGSSDALERYLGQV